MNDLTNMTVDELAEEIQHLDSYFLRCRELGQGISTKESAQFREACALYIEQGGDDFRLEYDNTFVEDFVEDWAKVIEMNRKFRESRKNAE